MNWCLLIAGMPASGKSTLAEKLSAELGIPMFSKDSLKEILFDDLGFDSREEKVQLGVTAMHMLYCSAEQLMKAGKPFILENNFEDSSKPELTALLKKYACTGITIRLTGDPKIIYQRFLQRDHSAQRHRGHVVNDHYPEMEGSAKENPTAKTYEQFLQDIQERGYDRFSASGPVIEVNAENISTADISSLVSQIRDTVHACEK